MTTANGARVMTVSSNVRLFVGMTPEQVVKETPFNLGLSPYLAVLGT
jgi:hypothetical protein